MHMKTSKKLMIMNYETKTSTTHADEANSNILL